MNRPPPQPSRPIPARQTSDALHRAQAQSLVAFVIAFGLVVLALAYLAWTGERECVAEGRPSCDTEQQP